MKRCYLVRHAQSVWNVDNRIQGHSDLPLSPLGEQQAQIHLGSWEGLTPAELDAKFPGAYRQWTTAPSRVTIPGAEPLEDFRRRVRGAFARVTEQFEEGEYVVGRASCR